MRRLLPCLVLAAAILHPAAGAPPQPYRIPYRLTDTQHILVRAKLNGKGPFNFIVDTGAPTVFIAPAAAKQAGLKYEGQWTTLDRLEIEGGAVLEKQQARVENLPQLSGMNAMGLAGRRLDGVLGYSVLSRFRMEIDLARSWMRWTPVPYQPQPLLTLEEITGGKKPAAAPPDGSGLELISRVAGFLFARAPDAAPVPRGFFGFELEEAPAGVRVGSVLPGSPAAAAGLRKGDLILKAGSTAAEPGAVKTAAEVLKAAAGIPAEQELVLVVRRAEGEARLTLKAGKGAF